jgi:hypothetical protein
MLKVSKVGVLIAVMALSGLLASSAGAAEWHTNGPLEITSTDAGASRLAVHTSTGIVVVQCATSSGTVTLRGPTIAGSTAPGIATVQPRFGGACTVSGAAGYSVACDEALLNANTFSGGLIGGITGGTITNIDCRISIGATACSTVTGSVNGHYINPNVATGTNGTGSLVVTALGQNLTVAKIGAGCAALPHGTGTFGSLGAGSTVGNLTYTVDGPHAPRITRTA